MHVYRLAHAVQNGQLVWESAARVVLGTDVHAHCVRGVFFGTLVLMKGSHSVLLEAEY